ncbi:sodium:solute symporter family protein [Kangiella marina]|uniref:Sodium:solute symporter family protein n=1 Tax=Kangiella marina TaxID=1079178 RepID=A0ABP8IL10_9GAMM
MNAVVLGVTLFVIAQLMVGLWASRKPKSETDFLLAGRQLKPSLAVFTIFATWFGAETCIGAASSIYDNGLSGGTADPFGFALCLFVMGFVFAMPLWKRKFVTFADLFRQRYSPSIEKLVVLILVPASMLWAAAQIRAFGQVLSSLTGLQVEMTITIAAAVVIIYTMLGGLLAVAVTDVIQASFLILGLVLLGIFVFTSGDPNASLSSVDAARFSFVSEDSTLLQKFEAWAIPIFGSVLTQELITRVLACRSAEEARRSTLRGASLYLVIGLIPVYLGLVGLNLMPNLADSEQLLPQLAKEYLPTFLYILFAGALVSAILSTVDSVLLAASSLISHNIVVPFRKKQQTVSERQKVLFARVGIVVLGSIAYYLALHAKGVYDLVVTASAFGSAGVFVVGTFGLFTRFGGQYTAAITLITAATIWLLGEFVFAWSTPFFISLITALGVYLVVGWIEGRFTGPLTAEKPL